MRDKAYGSLHTSPPHLPPHLPPHPLRAIAPHGTPSPACAGGRGRRRRGLPSQSLRGVRCVVRGAPRVGADRARRDRSRLSHAAPAEAAPARACAEQGRSRRQAVRRAPRAAWRGRRAHAAASREDHVPVLRSSMSPEPTPRAPEATRDPSAGAPWVLFSQGFFCFLCKHTMFPLYTNPVEGEEGFPTSLPLLRR